MDDQGRMETDKHPEWRSGGRSRPYEKGKASAEMEEGFEEDKRLWVGLSNGTKNI